LLMKMELLAIATFPEPDPATVTLPTLLVIDRNRTSAWLWLRIRQTQSSYLNRFGQPHRPLAMKLGLLTMATAPGALRLWPVQAQPPLLAGSHRLRRL
jgi:hypothetical protein